MRLKITGANVKKYLPSETASKQYEYEAWLIIERPNGKHIGRMHLWGLTKKEAEELELIKELNPK